MNPISAIQAELVAGLHDARIASGREAESGRGAARALDDIVDRLGKNGANGAIDDNGQQTTFALGLAQVNADGQRVSTDLNKPDISFLIKRRGKDQRVNIEIETQNTKQHADTVNANDPNAMNLYLKVHPWTGKVQYGYIRRPGTNDMTRISQARANKLIDQHLKAVPDPTLSVTKRGTQTRPAAGKPTASTSKAVSSAARPARRARGPARELETEFEHEFARESESESVVV